MESFVLKVPILGPHLSVYERNAITRAGYTIIWHSDSTSKGSHAQMVRLFFGLHLYLAGRCCENLQSVKGPAQNKSGQGNNMVSRRRDGNRSGYWSGRDSSNCRSSRFKHRTNFSFLQLKNV